MQISVKADVRSAKLFLSELDPGHGRGVNRATSRALNKTATSVRAEAARMMKKKRDIPVSEIKQQMSIKRATVRKLEAVVVVSGRPISIRHFARHGARGVTVRIEQGSKRTRLSRYGNKAFVNPVWRPGVFIRKGKKRLPIVAWPPVPGLPSVFLQDHIVAAMKRLVRDVFPRRFNEEMNYEINKARIKAARAGTP